VLSLKAKMDLIFAFLPLDIRDPNMVYISPLIQPFITPTLQQPITPYGFPTPISSKKLNS
jgi:hypothetical protein